MAIADYLQKLVELKKQLAANLRSMGVAAEDSEKLNTLVPKVLECKTEQNVEFVEGTNFTGTTSSLAESGFMKSISKVNIPYGTMSIGDYAFYSVRVPYITIPDSVTSIGSWAFEGCESLKSITIPDSVTSIGDWAFSNCSNLESITIPEGITSISNGILFNSKSLESVIIPKGVTSIGNSAFDSCSSLANIYYKGTSSQWSSITKGNYWRYNMGSNVSGGTVIHYNYVP